MNVFDKLKKIIKEFFSIKKQKKILVFLFFIVVLCGVFYFYQNAFAQDAQSNKTAATSPEIGQYITMIIGWVLYPFVAFMGYITMLLFEFFVEFAKYNNFVNEYSVVKGWTIVRDVCNLSFVIILLVIAFATILRKEDWAWKKLLKNVLIAAVLINFSKLFVGLIIDAAQVFMMTFVNGFSQTIGGNLINGLQLDKLFALSPSEVNANLSASSMLIALLIGFFEMMLTLAVMLVYVVVIVTRIVMLWILTVLSPFAFLLNTLPLTKKYASEWWGYFLKEVFVGPLIAFFLWLSLLVMSQTADGMVTGGIDINTPNEGQSQVTQMSAGPSKAGGMLSMMSYIVGIALMCGSLIVAQKMSKMGAGVAKSALGTVEGVARGIYRKPYGWAKKRSAERWKNIKEASGVPAWLKEREQRRKASTIRAMETIKGGIGATAGLAKGAVYGSAPGRWALEKLKQRKEKKSIEYLESQKKEKEAREERDKRFAENKATAADWAAVGKEKSTSRVRQMRVSVENEVFDNEKKVVDSMSPGARAAFFASTSPNNLRNKARLQALAMKMADEGDFKTMEEVNRAKMAFAGNQKKHDEFRDIMEKKNPNLFYNLKEEDQQKEFLKRYDKGKIKISDLAADAWKGDDGELLIETISKAKGVDKETLKRTLTKAGEDNPAIRENIEKSVANLVSKRLEQAEAATDPKKKDELLREADKFSLSMETSASDINSFYSSIQKAYGKEAEKKGEEAKRNALTAGKTAADADIEGKKAKQDHLKLKANEALDRMTEKTRARLTPKEVSQDNLNEFGYVDDAGNASVEKLMFDFSANTSYDQLRSASKERDDTKWTKEIIEAKLEFFTELKNEINRKVHGKYDELLLEQRELLKLNKKKVKNPAEIAAQQKKIDDLVDLIELHAKKEFDDIEKTEDSLKKLAGKSSPFSDIIKLKGGKFVIK